MRKISFTTFLICIALLTAVGLGVFRLYPQIFSNSAALLQTNTLFTPPPLRGPLTGKSSTLTVAGIISETNRHRQSEGLPTLNPNSILGKAATSKTADMFAKQYFEHVSPSGEGPAEVVTAAGYSYLVVGENLALGNFASDVDVVQAWMDSPGHRANILSTNFQEIGVAAVQGTFENHTVWIAVQEFATAASVCPTPASAQKNSLDITGTQQEQLAQELATQKNSLATDNQALTTLAQTIASLTKQADEKIEAGNSKIAEGNHIYQDTGSKEEALAYWNEGEKLQAEGNTLIEQAKQKQAEAETLETNLKTANQTYNQLVSKYNQLIGTLKTSSSSYNQAVQTYNKCLEQYTDSH